MAEAASRVDRPVDDTQAAFTDIKELIPEEESLEAVSYSEYSNEPTSGDNQPPRQATQAPPPAPEINANNGEPDADAVTISASVRGISPASDNNDPPADGDGAAKNVPMPTQTFNEKARTIQGDEMLTQHQEAMDRIVANWQPQQRRQARTPGTGVSKLHSPALAGVPSTAS